jgi:hypothetical protein
MISLDPWLVVAAFATWWVAALLLIVVLIIDFSSVVGVRILDFLACFGGVKTSESRVDSENVTVVQASFMNFYSQLDQRMSE